MEFKDWLNLNEILDSPMPYKWIRQNKFNFEAKFKIKEKEYSVTLYANSDPTNWDLYFKQTVPNFTHGKTGTGDAGQVFATVLAVVRDFENKANPNGINFQGSAGSRNDLYQKLLQKYLPAKYTKTKEGDLFHIRRINT